MKVKWLLLFLVLSRLVQAQGPGVIWAQSAGGVGMDNGVQTSEYFAVQVSLIY